MRLVALLPCVGAHTHAHTRTHTYTHLRREGGGKGAPPHCVAVAVVQGRNFAGRRGHHDELAEAAGVPVGGD